MPTGEVQFSSSSVNRPNSWNNTQKAGLSESLTPSIKISHPSMTTSEKSLTPLNPVGRAASQPVLSRQVTRSTAKMAEAEAKTALTNFVTGTDRSSHFEARSDLPSTKAYSLTHSMRTVRVDQQIPPSTL